MPDQHHHADHHHHHQPPSGEQARDPVCGMTVDPATARHSATVDGTRYVFCCAGCRDKFVADPAKYLAPAASTPAPPAAPGTTYTCPMHPEIRQAGPGSCPICGMALEPADGGAETGPSPERIDMTKRFWIGAALAIPTVLLAMGAHLPWLHLHHYVPPRLSAWLQCAFASPVVLWAGWPFLVRGWTSVRRRALNMFSLIALGVGAAYLDSLAATIAPSLFPAGLHQPDGTVPVYYEAAAVITVLVLLGQIMELRARERTGGAIRALMDLAPKTACRVGADGTETEIPLREVQVGDRLRVRPGDGVPVDGVVLDGRSAVDESVVTGESLPVEKAPGAALTGGTLNGTGALVMRAERIGADTVLARIVDMVAQAQRSRAPVQRLADGVAAWFVPAVIAVAVVAFAAWMVWGPAPAFAYALTAAVAVLIIACPCALGLATPMSIMVGVGKGAAAGVLVRDAAALEGFERIDTLVVDKTGTLTEGRPRVVAVLPAEGFDEPGLLAFAAGLERASEHPLAAAIVAEAHARGIALPDVADFDSRTGKGVTGTIDGRAVAIGNAALLDELGVAHAHLAARADDLRRDGATAMMVAVDGRVAGIVAVADPIKAGAAAALERLRAEGIRIVMLTGDNRITAQSVAARLGITEVEAETLPAQKNAAIRRLRDEGRVVAMAGDGVNDAPALAEAQIGIAMGTGTEIAMRSAAITLVKGDLAGIVRARVLSRATMRNIRQNLVLAFAYNALGIPLAAGVLYPAFGWLLSPVVAAAAMSLSSVSVIGNALRLNLLRLA